MGTLSYPKLGDIITRRTLLGRRRFILTSVIGTGTLRARVWTPVPCRMSSKDLGRRFVGAYTDWVETAPEARRG